MSFQMHGLHLRSEQDDLEGGRALATSEDTGLLHACYPYLFERGPRSSWKLFGCCTLVGLINVFSTLFTLAGTASLRFSDMLIESNAILLSTGALISLFWRLHSSHYQSAKEQNQASNELSSRTKLCVVGSFCTVLLSPTVACLPLLVICWFMRSGTILPHIPEVPLILSWVSVNTMATLPIAYLLHRRKIREQTNSSEGYTLLQEGIEDCDTYESLDETDGPTFLAQYPAPAYHSIFGGPLSEEAKAGFTFAPDVSWKIEPPEALGELVHWATSVPGESLPPSVASELLAMAAISIGVSLDGMGSWTKDTQYRYLMSRTCDRLAELFQQADPSAVPEHTLIVFLLVNRSEQFDGVDVAALGADNDYIPVEELKRIVRCLKSRSASLLGC